MFWLATFTFSLFPSPYSYFLERSATLRKRVAHISFMLKKIGAFVCTTNILLQKTIRMCLRLVFGGLLNYITCCKFPTFLVISLVWKYRMLHLFYSFSQHPIFSKDILILLFIVREHLVFDVYKQTPKHLNERKGTRNK